MAINRNFHEGVDEKEATTHLDRVESVNEPGLKDSEALQDASARGQGVSGYETLSSWETVKTFKLATLYCFLATFSAATDGYQLGINANIIANAGFIRQFATEINKKGAHVLASPILSAWGSITSVGQIIGMTTLPFISNRFGRKVAMYCFWFILCCSVICESVASTWQVWLVGKLLAGCGIGCVQITIPTYVAELAPTRIRGGLITMYNFWFSLGVFFAPLALQIMSKSDRMNYKTPIYTQWGQLGLLFVIILVLPETPMWATGAGKEDLAKKLLSRLNSGVRGYDVDHQYELLSMTIEHERSMAKEERKENWWAIFQGVNRTRTVAALWSLTSQQFYGLTLFSSFAAYFFQQAGLRNPFMITAIKTSMSLATIIFIALQSDRWGRRWVACSGAVIAWTACLAIGILGVSPANKASGSLLIFFACCWQIGITFNGASGWVAIGEMSSQRLRIYTAGFSAAISCVVGVVMNVLTPYMVNANKWNWSLKTGWFYVGVGLPFAIGVWFVIPETKNRTAAELDELFERKIKPWRFHKTETATSRVVRLQNNTQN